MSNEYHNRYIQKVMNEVAEQIRKGLLPKFAVHRFIKQRLKHYGIYGRYLPPHFKLDVVDPLTPETETNDIKQVETSAG